METNTVIERPAELVAFDELRAGIVKMKEANANKVFDYTDPAGNKEARSYIFRLRRTKSAIAEVHKTTKSKALAACQAIDKEKRELIVAVDEMIDVHQKPIEAIEAQKQAELKAKAEAERLEKERIEKKRLDAIAKQEKENARKEAELKAMERRVEEENARQVAKIKAEEDRIAREREKFEAEKKAEADARQREKDAVIRAEAEKKEALKRAEREKKEAVEAEKRKAEAEALAKAKAEEDRIIAASKEKARLAEIERKRVENEKHRKKIELKAIQAFTGAFGIDFNSEDVVSVIKDGHIPNVTINY